MTEASMSCLQKSYFSLTVSTNLIFIHTMKKVSVTNFLSEKDTMLLLLVFDIFFFHLKMFKYSKPKLRNLTHCLLRCYGSLGWFSPPPTSFKS